MQHGSLATKLDQVARVFDRILYGVTAISAAAFFLIILIAVLARYARIPWLSAVEWSRLLFVWSCTCAAALAYNRGAHISLTFLTDRMSQPFQNGLLKLGHALAGIFFLSLTISSWQVVAAVWPTRLPTSGLSQGWFYIPLMGVSPVMALYAFRFLLHVHFNPQPE